MNSSTPKVICDAGPLIHLDELGCLDLWADFETVLVPEQVWQEVEHHRPDALNYPEVTMQRVSVDLAEHPSFQTLVRALALDLGEQAALSLTELYPKAILLTDDAAAFDVVNKGELPAVQGKRRWAFGASLRLNRKEFGLQWRPLIETGGLAVADMVDSTIEIVVVQG